MDDLTVLGNYGKGGLIAFVAITITNMILKYFKDTKKDVIETKDSDKIFSQLIEFTQSNIELITVLTKNLKTYEKDQKQILENMQQILNILITMSISVGKVDDRTKTCLQKQKNVV